jgi:hypothetical protein
MREEEEVAGKELGRRFVGVKRSVGVFLAGVFPQTTVRRWAWRLSMIQAFVRSRLLQSRAVYVVGDSHTQIFRWEKPFVVFAIGPATAYNLGNRQSATDSNRKLFQALKLAARQRDTVLMVFGEIDCRMHIYNQYMKGNAAKPMTFYIDKTIAAYGLVLEQVAGMGIDLYVHGIPPAARQDIAVDAGSSIEFYAPGEIRSEINRVFNERLKSYCEERGYRYIDIYSKVVDEGGMIAEPYVGDEVHMNPRALPFFKESMGLT